jgi:putative transcriptional regulator
MAIRNRLKALRVEHGDLTQEVLAKRAGCSRQTIHSIEKGRFVPSVELSLRIAGVLGVRIEDLFSLAD